MEVSITKKIIQNTYIFKVNKSKINDTERLQRQISLVICRIKKQNHKFYNDNIDIYVDNNYYFLLDKAAVIFQFLTIE